jgi:hypothetical protein
MLWLKAMKGGTIRWNWHITPDLCLATSWLHNLIWLQTTTAYCCDLVEVHPRVETGGIDQATFGAEKIHSLAI